MCHAETAPAGRDEPTKHPHPVSIVFDCESEIALCNDEFEVSFFGVRITYLVLQQTKLTHGGSILDFVIFTQEL